MNGTRFLRRIAVASAAALLAATPLSSPVEANGWEEGGFADAIMCDFDGDGSPSEYVGVGNVLAFVHLHEDGKGVTHAVLMERHDGTEYYSVDADESIFVTGRTQYVGTLGQEFFGDGRGSVDYTIADAAGNVVARVAGSARFIDGAIEPIRMDIDGPCGMPYEPAE